MPLVISVLLILVSLTPLAVLALAAAVVLWGWYWPFSKRIDSLVLRIAIAFALVASFEQLTAALFWALHLNYTVPVAVVLQALVLLVLCWRWPERAKVPLIRPADIAALGVSLASLLVLAAGTLHGGPLTAQLMRFVTTGYDNTEHISLTISVYDNKGYVYGPASKELDKVLYSNLSSYPQGWQLSTSLWWHGVSNNLDVRQHPTRVLFMYWFMVMVWYGMLLYLLCRLILYLVELIRGKANDLAGYIAAVLFTGIGQAIFIASLLVFGFASFYPALVYPLVVTFLLIELVLEMKASDALPRFLLTGLLIAGGMTFSWLLSAPIPFLMVLLGMLYYFKGSIMDGIRWLWGHKLVTGVAIVIVAVASIQGMVQVLYGVKDLINIPGGINPLNPLVIVVLLVFALMGVAVSRAQLRPVLTAALSGAFLVAGAVYGFQVLSSGQPTYFSIKAAFVALLLLVAFGSAGIIALLQDRVLVKLSSLAAIIFLVGLAVFLPQAANIQLETTALNGIGSLSYARGVRYLAPATATTVADLVMTNKAHDGNVLIYKQVNYSEDILTTHFLGMLIRHEIPACRSQLDADLTAGWSVNPDTLKQCADQTHKDYYLIASAKNAAELKQTYAGVHNVKVIEAN